jgi:hypothetical protein
MDKNDKRNISGAQFTQPPEEFQVHSATSAVTFQTEDAVIPEGSYIGLDDLLLVNEADFSTTVGININLRILRPDGIILPMTFKINQNQTRQFTQKTFPLVEGWLLSLDVIQALPLSSSQWTYVTVGLLRNPLGRAAQYMTLVAGYVNGNIGMSYPQSPIQRASDGAGMVVRGTVAAPAAGAELIYVVPLGARQRLISFTGTLVSAVAVANRVVALLIDDGANVLATIPSNNTQVASTTAEYTFADGATLVTAAAGNNYQATPQNMFLFPGWRVSTLTAGIQGADQWSVANLHLMEWCESA